MDIVGKRDCIGLHVELERMPIIAWFFSRERWGITFRMPFLWLRISYDSGMERERYRKHFEEIARSNQAEEASVRSALANISAVKRVERDLDDDLIDYFVVIDRYEPDVTYAIAKALVGKGVRYRVVLAGDAT